MLREIWLNLPVKDVMRSKEFYTQVGFNFNPKFNNGPDNACMICGDRNFIVMLFPEATFKNFTKAEIADSKTGSQMLISIDALSREEVDNYAAKAEAAGGTVFGKPGESQGWLYGCGFTDLDGHRWNVLYRDLEKMPGKK
jgi:uncharacterized protein